MMPCDKPEQMNQKLNEKDKRTVVKVDGWRCGEPPNTTAGAFVAELAKTPTSEADATHQLLAAADQLARGDKPKRGEFLGHPGVTKKITQNGKTFALQGVAVDKYMVIFMAPADKLDVLTDSVTIS